MTDLFLSIEKCDISNYADDCTLYASQLKTSNDVIEALESDSKILFNWFKINGLKANPEKSHLILSSSDTKLYATIDNNKIKNQQEVLLLGITIENKLTFNNHMSKLCMKASKKLHALIQVAKYMNETQRKKIMYSFIYSLFQYCPLVWFFCSRKFNTRINKIHERALRVVYRDINLTFCEILYKRNIYTIHERSVQDLAIELFKVKRQICPEVMAEIFISNNASRRSSRVEFKGKYINSIQYGVKSLTHLAPKIWAIIPSDIKEEDTLQMFKRKIRGWRPKKCPCRLCETYVVNVGFVNVRD